MGKPNIHAAVQYEIFAMQREISLYRAYSFEIVNLQTAYYKLDRAYVLFI